MHKRLEDLGRIRERLEMLLKEEVFNHSLFGTPRRFKDVPEWIETLSNEEVSIKISDYYIAIERVSEAIYSILEIARGDDAQSDA